ncbi:hypothetical protein POX_e07318 [Penicillium oxalicum]|uniref:hypothetical protein n=1 Tax=Penicillium oxalicum TaxID=69781 RepID=UPI0020B84B1D|nr:hypothetical protein POX_e07318 [Penicillium oxalicum]KAI2789288.1 hypothetical protein POX_e07318 [Penicillium oxalicum]
MDPFADEIDAELPDQFVRQNSSATRVGHGGTIFQVNNSPHTSPTQAQLGGQHTKDSILSNMKISIASILIVAGLAVAQDLTQLPFCAISCAFRAIASAGCSVTDAKCICTKDSFFTDINSCLTTSCSGDNKQSKRGLGDIMQVLTEGIGMYEAKSACQPETIDFARSFCGSAGVSIPTPPKSSAPMATATRPASSTTVFSSSVVATASPTVTNLPSHGAFTHALFTPNVDRLPRLEHILVVRS